MERVEKLATEVSGLRAETARLHVALDKHTGTVRRLRQWVVAGLVVLTLCGVVAVWQLHAQVDATNAQVEAARRSAQDQRRLCPLVSLLIPRPGEAPPSTPRGVRIAEAARNYATAIHC